MTDLILVPTPGEQEVVSPILQASELTHDWATQLCGLGPIASAARTAALISRYKPQRVLLIGIAGAFDVETQPVGSACRFEQVACYGVGSGAGANFRGTDSLGLQQFSGGDPRPTVGDVIDLVSTFVHNVPCQGQLLTACACSTNAEEVQQRTLMYPNAVAEDMEGFGVAMACTLAGVPLQIVRGISNRVGDRNHANWQIVAALQAAAQLALKIIPWKWIPTES